MQNQQNQNLTEAQKLNSELIDAAAQQNLARVMELIDRGADPNFIKYTDSNCWYSGNTHTALYSAVNAKFEDEKTYTDIVEVLLKKGANPNFKATRGGWNHSEDYPLFNGVINALNKFKTTQEKIRLIEMFVKAGISINQCQSHGRSKNWRAHRTNTNFVFQMLGLSGMGGKLRELSKFYEDFAYENRNGKNRKQLRKKFNKERNIEEKPQIEEAKQTQGSPEPPEEKKEEKQPDISLVEALINFGANVNSSRSYHYWQNYNADVYDENYTNEGQVVQNEYETLLHRAIMHNSVKLVKLLLDKGADASKGCTFTVRIPHFAKDWSQKYRQIKFKQNQANLRYAEQRKQQLQKQASPKNQKQHKEILLETQFNIYCCKNYDIQTENPIYKYEDKHLTCLELAEKLKVNEEIIEILKNWKPKTENQVKNQFDREKQV